MDKPASDYDVWGMDDPVATCPDCDQRVRGADTVGALLDAIDEHECAS